MADLLTSHLAKAIVRNLECCTAKLPKIISCMNKTAVIYIVLCEFFFSNNCWTWYSLLNFYLMPLYDTRVAWWIDIVSLVKSSWQDTLVHRLWVVWGVWNKFQLIAVIDISIYLSFHYCEWTKQRLFKYCRYVMWYYFLSELFFLAF